MKYIDEFILGLRGRLLRGNAYSRQHFWWGRCKWHLSVLSLWFIISVHSLSQLPLSFTNCLNSRKSVFSVSMNLHIVDYLINFWENETFARKFPLAFTREWLLEFRATIFFFSSLRWILFPIAKKKRRFFRHFFPIGRRFLLKKILRSVGNKIFSYGKKFFIITQ